MPQIDMMPEHRARLPKNVHDLSHSFGFTCTCAHLLPVYHDLLDAGEKVRLKFDFNLRTQPLESAAMEDLEVHTEYFFVPMNLLYEPYGSMKYGIDDVYSTAQRDYFSSGAYPVSPNFPLLKFFALDDEHNSVFYVVNEKASNVLYQRNSDSLGVQFIRLMNHFGFNPDLNGGYYSFNPNVFPYQLLAYNCIYQYYYRLDSREKFDPSTFNWDNKVAGSLVLGTDIDVEKIFSIKYRPYQLDYFTNVKVSPIVDTLNNYDTSVLPVVSDWLTRSTAGSNSVITSGYEGNGASFDGTPFQSKTAESRIQTQFGLTKINTSYASINGYDIGTANIRAMFANEKLWSITGRAKKRYDDQVLAHLGFNVPHDPKHEISVFGHDISTIHIGEVISTASTDAAPLGEIAGKGYGTSKSSYHDFTAPCDGVVMIIFSVVPKMRYDSPFLKINSIANPLNLPKPEYDHLGMQPLFNYEFGHFGYPDNKEINLSSIVGWQYRYEEFKKRPNRTTLIFGNDIGASLSSWMFTRNLDTLPPAEMSQPANIGYSYRYFVHRPDELNQIFLQEYSGIWSNTFFMKPSLIYATDPFVVDSYISSKKISWLSDYGLPRLDA